MTQEPEKLIEFLCECGDTIVIHGNLPGKTQCLAPGCGCLGFKKTGTEPPVLELVADRKELE